MSYCNLLNKTLGVDGCGDLAISTYWDFAVSVLVSVPSLWQNAWDNQLKRKKGLPWLLVSEVSVYAVALLLWGQQWSRPSKLGARDGSERSSQGPHLPVMGHVPSDLTCSHLLKEPPPLNSNTGWRPSKPLAYVPWGTLGSRAQQLHRRAKLSHQAAVRKPTNHWAGVGGPWSAGHTAAPCVCTDESRKTYI
jgi:hypothetical protein